MFQAQIVPFNVNREASFNVLNNNIKGVSLYRSVSFFMYKVYHFAHTWCITSDMVYQFNSKRCITFKKQISFLLLFLIYPRFFTEYLCDFDGYKYI